MPGLVDRASCAPISCLATFAGFPNAAGADRPQPGAKDGCDSARRTNGTIGEPLPGSGAHPRPKNVAGHSPDRDDNRQDHMAGRIANQAGRSRPSSCQDQLPQRQDFPGNRDVGRGRGVEQDIAVAIHQENTVPISAEASLQVQPLVQLRQVARLEQLGLGQQVQCVERGTELALHGLRERLRRAREGLLDLRLLIAQVHEGSHAHQNSNRKNRQQDHRDQVGPQRGAWPVSLRARLDSVRCLDHGVLMLSLPARRAQRAPAPKCRWLCSCGEALAAFDANHGPRLQGHEHRHLDCGRDAGAAAMGRG